MYRNKKTRYRVLTYFAAAVTLTSCAMLTGCGEKAYADQTTVAELTGAAGAALIRDGFYNIEVPSYRDADGRRMALDIMSGSYQPGCALPVAASDNSSGQQFMVMRRGEGIYTIQNANTMRNVKIMTGLAYAGADAQEALAFAGDGSVDVELWKIVVTPGGDTMLAPYLLTTSLFEQITVDSFGQGADLVRPWTFVKTQVGINESDIVLSFDEAEYTGEPILPDVTIIKAGKALVENTDYVVVYENNKDIGTAKVRVSGIGEYVGAAVKEFEITAIDIAKGGDVVFSESEKASISSSGEGGITTYAYTGEAVEPGVEVTFNGNVLAGDVDYTISFSDNINPGAVRVDIEGMGIYRGSFNRSFVIGGVETRIDPKKTYTLAPKSHGADRLAITNGGITTGTTISTSAASDDEKEKFQLFENEDGTYRIISTRSGFCLEDIAGSVRLGEYEDKAGQRWVTRKNQDDTFTFENAATGQILSAAADTRDDGGNSAVSTVSVGTESIPKETRDMHFYLVETEAVDAFAEGYYSATYDHSEKYSIAYGTQNGRTGLYIQDGDVTSVMSLVYSGDGWYRVLVGMDNKVLTSDSTGNLSEAIWSGTDAQRWRFERSDGTPLTAAMAGVGDPDENNISDDGTPGAYTGAARFTARLVNKEGIALTAPVDSIDRAINFTSNEFLQSVANVYATAHNNHYIYGSSATAVPCADGIISCDRLVARAVYNMGLTDQPVGGITLNNMTSYLQRYGFVTFTDLSSTRAGDIMMVADAAGSLVHTFVVASYDAGSGSCTKYDLGSQSRIDMQQPLATALDEWSDKDIAYGIRNPYSNAPAYAIKGSDDSDSVSQLWIFEK